MKLFSTYIKLLSSLLLLLSFSTYSSVTLMGTRVIYPENAKYVNLQFRSPDDVPSIMEVWVSKQDNATATSKEADAPFITTPQVFRIDPNKGQSVKLTYTGANLPTDRESVFYLNFLQIPAIKKGNQKANKLVITYRSTVKVFYRPAGLKNAPNDVISQLKVDASRLSSGKLTINNPTEYYVSLDSIDIKNQNKTLATALGKNTGMIAPFSQQQISIKPVRNASSINIKIVNDLGGISDTVITL